MANNPDNSTVMNTLKQNIASPAVTVCVEELEYNDSGAMMYTLVIILIFAFGIMMMIAAQVARAETVEPNLIKFMKESEQLAYKQRLEVVKNLEAILPTTNTNLEPQIIMPTALSSSSGVSLISLAPIRESQNNVQSSSPTSIPCSTLATFSITSEDEDENTQKRVRQLQGSFEINAEDKQIKDPLLNPSPFNF